MTDFTLLKELYWIHSPSTYENGIQGYIRNYLNKYGIKFDIDNDNQTYSLSNQNKPLIVVHTDQVSFKPITQLFETKDKIYGNSNIGADDKNGIWILLQLLKDYPDLNFIFSNQEEIGGKIDNLLRKKQDTLLNIPYCLVFDRKGKGDIIGSENQYCSIDFENELSEIGKAYSYKSGRGVWSDCDNIRYYLNCVNLSCGYHEAHTKKEYTVKSELLNALEFAKAIIDNVTKSFDLEWSNQYYDDDDIMSICPHCYANLEDVLEGNPEYGQYCLFCQYETNNYILDRDCY